VPCTNEGDNDIVDEVGDTVPSAVAFGVKTGIGKELLTLGKIFVSEQQPLLKESEDNELESFTTAKKAQMVRELAKALGEKGDMQNAALAARDEVNELFNVTEKKLFHDFKGAPTFRLINNLFIKQLISSSQRLPGMSFGDRMGMQKHCPIRH